MPFFNGNKTCESVRQIYGLWEDISSALQDE